MKPLLRSVVDLSGRPFLIYHAKIQKERVGKLDAELVEEFWKAFVTHARVNLHIELLYGRNAHHVFEVGFQSHRTGIEPGNAHRAADAWRSVHQRSALAMAAASIRIIDYGMGNLRSVEKAVAAVGGRPEISRDPDIVRKSRGLILPGVGAFGDGMAVLRRKGLDEAIFEAVREGTPLLGLCLGLQMLFDESEEFGEARRIRLDSGESAPDSGA